MGCKHFIFKPTKIFSLENIIDLIQHLVTFFLNICLDMDENPTFSVSRFLFFFYQKRISCGTQTCQWCTRPTTTLNVQILGWNGTVNGSRALFTGLTNIFFTKTFIKNGSHSTIHTFKNYFATVFLVFSNKRYPNKL